MLTLASSVIQAVCVMLRILCMLQAPKLLDLMFHAYFKYILCQDNGQLACWKINMCMETSDIPYLLILIKPGKSLCLTHPDIMLSSIRNACILGQVGKYLDYLLLGGGRLFSYVLHFAFKPPVKYCCVPLNSCLVLPKGRLHFSVDPFTNLS